MSLKNTLMSAFCAGLLGLALPVAAEQSQSYDQSYNFKAVKNIQLAFESKVPLDGNTSKVVEGITYQSAVKNMGKMAAMGKAFKFEAKDADACQVKLVATLTQYDSRKVMMMGTNRKLLGKVNIINQSQHGQSGIDVVHENYTRNEELPAYETEEIKVRVEFKAVDRATGKTIWQSVDGREKTNGHLETTTCSNMYKRIMTDFWTKFLVVVGK